MNNPAQDQKQELLAHLDKLHTTPMGVERIKRNLALNVEDVVSWCREAIQNSDTFLYRRGKNWYAETGTCVITVHATSYTIITAHRKKG